MKNLIMYKKGNLSWVLWIKKRILNNLNLNSITTGETGVGKSWFDLSLAYSIDKTYESRQVVFSFKQLMNVLNSEWFNKKRWKIIIFEEVQTSISNRAWQSLINKLFNYLLSTYRHKNIILLMNSPYSDFIDSHSKKLIHVIFEVKGHNSKTRMTNVRPKIMQYNSKLKKFYEHSLYVIRDGRTIKQADLFIDKTPKHLIEEYEKAKIEFTGNLNKEIESELNSLESENNINAKKKEIKILKPLTELQQKILECWKEGMIQKDIVKKLKKAQSCISESEKYMRNKGYYKETYTEISKIG